MFWTGSPFGVLRTCSHTVCYAQAQCGMLCSYKCLAAPE